MFPYGGRVKLGSADMALAIVCDATIVEASYGVIGQADRHHKHR